ncbi:MAG: hypothetical protein EHM36_04845 [Deltaproteobacteria bacterium]|nr:MAG: hypothetical protein EHM36_04845 [Deltaproteobacteria bacterium]
MCDSKHHGKHLCLNREAEPFTGATIYVECSKCGVKSGNPENVCHPVSPSTGWLGDGVLY